MSTPTVAAAAVKPVAPANRRGLALAAIVAVNMLGMVGLGAYLVVVVAPSSRPAEHPAGAAHGDEGEEEGEDEEEEADEDRELGPLIQFESMVVNLSTPTTDRYLKLTFELELREESVLERAESRMPVYRDAVLMYLSALTIEEAQGAQNAARIRDRLLELTHEAIGRRVVSHVYFTEYLVQ